MAKTLDIATTMTLEVCASCGISFAAPTHFLNKCQEHGRTFYCPNGHSLSYGPSPVEKLQAELEKAKREVANQKQVISDWAADYNRLYDEKAGVQKQLAATRGVLTRTRNRIQNGVCPCCRRSFTNLHRHMARQHPDYARDDES